MTRFVSFIGAKIVIAAVLAVAFISVSLAPSALAANCMSGGVDITSGKDCAKGTGVQENLFTGTDPLFQTVTNVLLFLIGAVSVIMLIVGGLRYVLSNGDSSAVTSAKNTILYAVIGIIVALLAYAIVNFVVGSFTSGSNGGGNGSRQTTGG